MALDHSNQQVIVAIRGSQSLHDGLVDLMCHSVEFQSVYDGEELIISLDTKIKKICYTHKTTITVLTFYDGILLSSHCPTHAPHTPSKPCFLFPYKPNSNPHLAFVITLTVISAARSVQY